ncbi:MAG: hypothetical protein ACLR76_06060 [Alistipes sp.]
MQTARNGGLRSVGVSWGSVRAPNWNKTERRLSSTVPLNCSTCSESDLRNA